MLSNFDAEEALVGSILQYPDQFASLKDELAPADFEHEPFGDAWRAFAALDEQGLTIDQITVGTELERLGCLADFTDQRNFWHGRVALSKVADQGRAEGAADYVVQVREAAAAREIKRELEQTATQLLNGRKVAAVQADHLQRIAEVRTPHQARTRTQSIETAVSEAMDMAERASRGELVSISTGLVELDGMLGGGLSAPDLYIVAARPGQGKTAMLTSMAHKAAKRGKRTLIFTLEMQNRQLAMRLIAIESGVTYDKQRRGAMTQEEWNAYYGAVETITNASNPYPIVLNDLPNITVGGMRRVLAQAGKVDLVMVDYLQLADADGRHDNRTQEVTEISRGLKALAKEFNVPVVAAAQLNRGIEQRSDKRPMLSDLRESGSIEQDADTVMFLHRPDPYEKDNLVQSTVEVIVAKQRNGPVGSVRLIFRPTLALFESGTERMFAPNGQKGV